MTFDQAASVQVGIIPFVVALYAQQPELAHLAPPLYACKLNLVPCLIFTIFVSIQLVKLFGFSPIITTASFHNTGLLSSRSATRVLDRNLSTIASKKTQLLRSRQLLALRHLTPALFLTHETAHDTITAGGTVIAVGVPQVDDRNEDKVVQQVFGSFHPPTGSWVRVSHPQWLSRFVVCPLDTHLILYIS